MKIATGKFNTFSSVISKTGNKEESLLFIDPDQKLCSCIGDDFTFKFHFDVLEENKEDLKPFRISIEKFLAIAQTYPELTIDKNYIFHGGSDKFKVYIEKDAKDLGFEFNYTDDTILSYAFSDNDLNSIGKAINFVGIALQVNDKDLNVVRVGPTSIIASDTVHLYRNNTTSDLGFKIDIRDEVAGITFNMHQKEFKEITIHYSENQNGFVIVDKNNTFELIAEPASKVHLPTEQTIEEINASIQRADKMTVEVNRDRLKEIIDFLGIFVNRLLNQPITITCSEDCLTIEAKDDIDNSLGTRLLDKEFMSSIDTGMLNLKFSFPRKNVFTALNSVYDSEQVQIAIGINTKNKLTFMEITEVGSLNTEKVIVILLG